jgi:hypothetical protein
MVPADGSEKIEDALMDAIEPFPYDKLKPFSMQYLSGFMAQKYDVTYQQIFPRVQKRVEEGSYELLRSDIHGYDSVVLTQKSAALRNVKKDYVLMPVWFLSYQYNGKDYFFAMNGQTGKQSGEAPLSVPKALLCSVLVAILVFVLSLIIGGAMFS